MKENYQISFEIVRDFETKKRKQIKLLLIIWLIIFPISIYKLHNVIGDSSTFTITLICCCIIFIGLILMFNSEPTWQKVGMLTLTPKFILINQNDKTLELKTIEIKSLTLLYTGYELETEYTPIPERLTHKEGNNNLLTIKTETDSKTYDLFIDSLSKVNILKYLFDYYNSKGISAKFIKKS